MTTTRTEGRAIPSLAAIAVLALAAGPAGAAGKIEFNRDIRPILAENCFRCHGPDSASRQADLRLDRREVAVSTGAITPGKPDESKLIRRIFSADPKEMMPPPSSKKKLSDAERETLRRWILDGAEYQRHWSLIPPSRPPLPRVKSEAWAVVSLNPAKFPPLFFRSG
jgi:mono/diheme cytochrome c family protein